MTNHEPPARANLDDLLSEYMPQRREPVETQAPTPRSFAGSLPPGATLAVVRRREFEPPRRSRATRGLALVGLATASAIVAGGYVFLWPGNGERPADQASVAQPEGPIVTEMPLPSQTSEPTPEPTPEPSDEPSVLETPSASPGEEAEPSSEPSEDKNPSDKPTKPESGKPKFIEVDTQLRVATLSVVEQSSKEIASVLATKNVGILAVQGASEAQFDKIPTLMGESYETVPSEYSSIGGIGSRPLIVDTSVYTIRKEGVIQIPGYTATSVDDLTAQWSYAVLEDKETKQIVVATNAQLTEEERASIVQKSKPKKSEPPRLDPEGKRKRSEQSKILINNLRAVTAGLQAETGQEIVVVTLAHMSDANQRYQYPKSVVAPDCVVTGTTEEKGDIELETARALEAGSDGCEDLKSSRFPRRIFVGTKGLSDIDTYAVRSNNSAKEPVSVLVADLDYTLRHKKETKKS